MDTRRITDHCKTGKSQLTEVLDRVEELKRRFHQGAFGGEDDILENREGDSERGIGQLSSKGYSSEDRGEKEKGSTEDGEGIEEKMFDKHFLGYKYPSNSSVWFFHQIEYHKCRSRRRKKR
ncbi:hypothetical protein ACJMK2_029435 [Sinanodonta woodiana]|uniref:Uncharacterized protein n=1 Tax=Sinanodonta woodiana TaxID=1069815 RepID=A0ABD3XA55_SINWO